MQGYPGNCFYHDDCLYYKNGDTGSPTRGDAILDLVVTNASEPFGDVKIRGSLGCSDHVLVELKLLREMGITKSIVRTLNFRRAKFQLFKEIDSQKDSLGNGPQGQGNRTELAAL